MSGIRENNGLLDDTYFPEEYLLVKESAERYGLLGVGLSIWCESKKPLQSIGRNFVVTNCYFPCFPAAQFSVLPSSLLFLVQNHMDLTETFLNGIPFFEKGRKNYSNEIKKDTNNPDLGNLFKYISLRKIPLILHNGFIDAAFLYHSFVGPLPDTLPEFCEKFSSTFPEFYDTKELTSLWNRILPPIIEKVGNPSWLDLIFTRCVWKNCLSYLRSETSFEWTYQSFGKVNKWQSSFLKQNKNRAMETNRLCSILFDVDRRLKHANQKSATSSSSPLPSPSSSSSSSSYSSPSSPSSSSSFVSSSSVLTLASSSSVSTNDLKSTFEQNSQQKRNGITHPCFHFVRAGRCHSGKKCNFNHDLNEIIFMGELANGLDVDEVREQVRKFNVQTAVPKKDKIKPVESTSFAHNPGFDAFATGYIFAYLLHQLLEPKELFSLKAPEVSKRKSVIYPSQHRKDDANLWTPAPDRRFILPLHSSIISCGTHPQCQWPRVILMGKKSEEDLEELAALINETHNLKLSSCARFPSLSSPSSSSSSSSSTPSSSSSAQSSSSSSSSSSKAPEDLSRGSYLYIPIYERILKEPQNTTKTVAELMQLHKSGHERKAHSPEMPEDSNEKQSNSVNLSQMSNDEESSSSDSAHHEARRSSPDASVGKFITLSPHHRSDDSPSLHAKPKAS
ncbi:putative target of EGR1 protein 1 [Monocercomonoides exilis]|uniref:putative target of EGR1 protein 1 n=1 Tax=Monocercomonoides exilis TaxID=2049356 RepID=UPI00355A87F3|nr:putative target of EGR1 protein 1 [Monocercomonoides exilis]|eukprot:MONOS_357.1-p1 / transcript=MONOS_357.1 / gene=MONOS_357 / organism=Monocercomonoides_exilis_PA203 / gene_product=unspecified product / transcript_product=unspecified product / location=Mono_scaffold00006:24392-26416(+) / protein_length=674 / sequence_SO=supercontig / SO=protein_coding / is_pseudo=false